MSKDLPNAGEYFEKLHKHMNNLRIFKKSLLLKSINLFAMPSQVLMFGKRLFIFE